MRPLLAAPRQGGSGHGKYPLRSERRGCRALQPRPRRHPADYIGQMGYGQYCDDLNPEGVASFLASLATYRHRLATCPLTPPCCRSSTNSSPPACAQAGSHAPTARSLAFAAGFLRPIEFLETMYRDFKAIDRWTRK